MAVTCAVRRRCDDGHVEEVGEVITRVLEVKVLVVQRDEQRALDPSVAALLDRVAAVPGVYAAGWKVEWFWRQAANDVFGESVTLVTRELDDRPDPCGTRGA